MELDNRKIRGADIQDLRELLNNGFLDMFWVCGTFTHPWRTKGEAGQKEITNTPLALLVRVLFQQPEANPVPVMPTYEEVYEEVKRLYPGKLSPRRFAMLVGKSGWSGNRWMHGGEPAPVIKRLFFVLHFLIKNYGNDGLNIYLELVEQEAKANGIEGGIKELFKKGTWGNRPKSRRKKKGQLDEDQDPDD